MYLYNLDILYIHINLLTRHKIPEAKSQKYKVYDSYQNDSIHTL